MSDKEIVMKYAAGFIGVGNMGGALADAVTKSVFSKEIALFDINSTLAKEKALQLDANFCTLDELCQNSNYIFVGVKPNIIASVLSHIKEYISEQTVIVSMAAGVSVDSVIESVGTKKVIRIMPNTPVTVGEGMVLYCKSNAVTDEEEGQFLKLMSNAGILDKLDEKLIDAAAALSGCGPAFTYMFMDALADGAVRCGLPRDKALAYVKQTVYGSAFLAMNSEKHLDKLKDDVCSPGGTTIEGVLELEKHSFRCAASLAVIAAYEKTKLL